MSLHTALFLLGTRLLEPWPRSFRIVALAQSRSKNISPLASSCQGYLNFLRKTCCWQILHSRNPFSDLDFRLAYLVQPASQIAIFSHSVFGNPYLDPRLCQGLAKTCFTRETWLPRLCHGLAILAKPVSLAKFGYLAKPCFLEPLNLHLYCIYKCINSELS